MIHEPIQLRHIVLGSPTFEIRLGKHLTLSGSGGTITKVSGGKKKINGQLLEALYINGGKYHIIGSEGGVVSFEYI